MSPLSKNQMIRLIKKFRTDRAIADHIGLSPQKVGILRRDLGVPAGKKKVNLSKKELMSLVQKLKSDIKVAELFNVTPQAITSLRRSFGIMSPKTIRIREARKKLQRYKNSKLPAWEIAAKLGLSISTVNKYLSQIHGYRGNPHISERTKNKVARLYASGEPLDKIVEITGISTTTIQKIVNQKGLPRRLNPFGVSKERLEKLYYRYESDHEVAKILGKPQFLVFYWRRRYGIPTIPIKDRKLTPYGLVKANCPRCGTYYAARRRMTPQRTRFRCSQCGGGLEKHQWTFLAKGRFRSEKEALKKLKPS